MRHFHRFRIRTTWKCVRREVPNYLKNAVVIISEMGLRPHKEFMLMKKP